MSFCECTNSSNLIQFELNLIIVHTYVSLNTKADENAPPQVKPYNDEELARIADDVLKAMDKNDDGFIEYTEYKSGNI